MADLSTFIYNSLLEKILQQVKDSSKVKFSLIGFGPVKDRVCLLLINCQSRFFIKPCSWALIWFSSFKWTYSGVRSFSVFLQHFKHHSKWCLNKGTFYCKQLSTHSRSSLYFICATWRKFSSCLLNWVVTVNLWCLVPNVSTEKNPKCFLLLEIARSFWVLNGRLMLVHWQWYRIFGMLLNSAVPHTWHWIWKEFCYKCHSCLKRGNKEVPLTWSKYNFILTSGVLYDRFDNWFILWS